MFSSYSFSPDTTDLQLRVGIHTGQVTAGVLRGERARFQLFGDSVNTAGHLEYTSLPNRIQVSDTTAEELRKVGKDKWLKERDDKISVKGKGLMQTYWLETRAESKRRALEMKYGSRVNAAMKDDSDDKPQEQARPQPSRKESLSFRPDDSERDFDLSENNEMSHKDGIVLEMTKTERLVEWNVEVLSYLLKQIIVSRPGGKMTPSTHPSLAQAEQAIGASSGKTVLDEFKEIIELPSLNSENAMNRRDPNSIELPSTVVDQLRDLIGIIAGMYRENPFHSFEHASHVTASVRKLLSRIVNANNTAPSRRSGNTSLLGDSELVDLSGHSFGIVSDQVIGVLIHVHAQI